MLVYRSTVAAAVLTSGLLVGCSAPDQPTDLRTDGPPNVTAVTVRSDLRSTVDPDFPSGGLDLARLLETATHCRIGDEKRPGLVGLPTLRATQVCPEDLALASSTEGTAEGAPPNWFVRIVFDKLLDPDVEELVDQLDANGNPVIPNVKQGTLLNTQPVTLKCNGVDVAYDRARPLAPISYYVPNGSRVSWPLGPALYIQPDKPVGVPTGATCEIGIKDMVVNKAGESVPTDQRTFQFKIAPMKLRFSVIDGVQIDDPADAADGTLALDPHVPVKLFWTAAFNPPDPAQIQIFEGPNLNATTGDGDPDPAVCGAGGTQVNTADVIQVANGPVGVSSALVMDVKLNTHPTNAMDKRVWKPTTTYRVEFGSNAKLTPTQGGADGTIPAGYKLCFHTTTAAM